MTENMPRRQLPVVLPLYPDELLSSWISRHATFYAVPPLIMLRHCLPEVVSLRASDVHLNSKQEIRLAKMFATTPSVIRRMTLTNVAQSWRRMIASQPTQICTNCCPDMRSRHLSCEANYWDGASYVRHAVANFGLQTGANSPPISSNIALRLCVAKSCSTMKPSMV